MKRKIRQFANVLVITLGLGLFILPNGMTMRLLAQVAGTSTQQSADSGGSQQMTTLQEAMSVNSTQQLLDDQMAKRQAFLQEIQQQLQSAEADYTDIKHNVTDTTGKLNDAQAQNMTLQGQIDILNGQIQDSVNMMQNVLTQVNAKEAQITALQEDIQIKAIAIENQKQMISQYLTILYKDDNSMDSTVDPNSPVNIAKLLLSGKSPDDALREVHYFDVLDDTGRAIFDKLQSLLNEQETEEATVKNSKNKLELLYADLEGQQSTLQVQEQAKTQLLSETQGQEAIFQQLIAQSTQEQQQSLEDINSLTNNLQFIQDKIAELGNKFNPDDFKSVLDQDTTNVYQYIKNNPNGDFSPSWPVSPNRGISAYFHDPSYLATMGVPHEAIDIRTPQGTPIHAPADGVVYKTRDNGFGYSYIILAHQGGFMTLYGHVSEIDCQEGQVIKRGQVIGLSGATPGTKGAGLMTTGPHLHFEVMKGGKHVDPLDYLPLAYLPLDSLPAKYLSRITGDAKGVSRTADADVAGATFSNSQELIQMEDAGFKAEMRVASQQAGSQQFGSD
jgi:murein DD-endopeptidase MepM/ murein hydrolase activator NlpD